MEINGRKGQKLNNLRIFNLSISFQLLDANRRAGGCSYLILRLPDVIGPRDTTKRTWFYILWIQFFEILKAPIIIPKHVQAVRASYVFARDVVRAIFHLTTNGFRDDVFNVGFEETLTLHKFLKLITSEMGKENVVEFDFTADETCNVFPSLSRGAVDVTKLKETGFQPTTPKEAIRVSWFPDVYELSFNYRFAI